MTNMFQPLFNHTYECFRTIKKIWTSLPSEISYPISDKMYYGSDLMIPIGVNKKNTQYLKIGGDTSHTYIVGQVGSGKSNLTKVILLSLVHNYPNTQLILLDYKRVELALFKNTKSCIQFEWSEEGISQALEDLLTLVLQRYEQLEMQGKTEADYKMSNIVCVIEEISLMSKQDMKVLRKICAISRAVHIYVIFTTQRPSNECLDNVVKSLVGNRICLKTDDKKNSVIALDEEGCELLRGKGHGYIKSNGYITEFQAYAITDEVVKDICSKHKADLLKIKGSSNKECNKELMVVPNDVSVPPQLIYVDNQSNNEITINDVNSEDDNDSWLDNL